MRRRDVLLAAPVVAAFAAEERPAILGGSPVRQSAFPSWPIAGSAEEDAMINVVRSGRWNRSERVRRFEEASAHRLGSKYGPATPSGTRSLAAAGRAIGVVPGD